MSSSKPKSKLESLQINCNYLESVLALHGPLSNSGDVSSELRRAVQNMSKHSGAKVVTIRSHELKILPGGLQCFASAIEQGLSEKALSFEDPDLAALINPLLKKFLLQRSRTESPSMDSPIVQAA